MLYWAELGIEGEHKILYTYIHKIGMHGRDKSVNT